MPEAVPTRNTPPLVAFDPDPVAAVTKISAATASGSAASHLFCIVALLLAFERRLVHRQRAFVRVERTTDAERNGSLVLAVPEWQLVEDWDAERLQRVFDALP